MCWFKKEKVILNNFKSISDLNRIQIKSISEIKKRETLKICVIDNEGYNPTNLINLGFPHVDVKESHSKLEDYGEYNIILCDVDGVATSIDAKKQGLALAKQIYAAYYPSTVVAIYSGKELNNYEYQEMKNVSVIRKSNSTHKLAEKIMELSSVLWDPSETWKVLEVQFRETGLSNKEIAILEDGFVRAYNSGSPKIDTSNYIDKDNKFDKLISAIEVITKFLLLWQQFRQ